MSAAVLPCVCAWCERVRIGGGQWLEGEPPDCDPAEISHGICPECLEEETRGTGLTGSDE